MASVKDFEVLPYNQIIHIDWLQFFFGYYRSPFRKPLPLIYKFPSVFAKATLGCLQQPVAVAPMMLYRPLNLPATETAPAHISASLIKIENP